jgi:CheY-like chemotaxis protein
VPGKGSRFSFAIPLMEAPPLPAMTETDSDAVSSDSRLAPGLQLAALVADDSSVNRRILASLLESAGVRVITAAGGLEAVELARKHRPDVVLMDLRMSDLDGFEATRRLGADAATAGIPVVAVSASAWSEVRQAARDAGCVDFVAKPVKADVLFAKLQRHAGARFVNPSEAPEPPLPALVSGNGPRNLASRLREAATIGSVADLDALAEELSTAGDVPGSLGRRIAALTAAFDYDALLRLAASLESHHESPDGR